MTNDNLFDPNNTAYSSETQPFDMIIKQAIDTVLRDLHTWLPAKITQVNPTGTVNIQPLLKRKYKSGDLVDLPVIQNVQVIMPRNDTYWVRLPIKVDDTGIALFCERSLDVWNIAGGSVDPADTRTHDLSDAIFIPGLYPMSSPVEPPATSSPFTDLVLHNEEADLILQKAGTFLMKNSNAELFDLFSKVIDLLSQTQQQIIDMNNNLASALVATLLGPQPLSTAATFTATASQVTALKAKVDADKLSADTLKGL